MIPYFRNNYLQERNDLRALLDSWQKETTVGSTENNQFEILQRTIDGYVQRMEQITNDSTLINNTNFGNSFSLCVYFLINASIQFC